jgi:uncharacterized protein YaiE (UPF0345 family)
LSIVEKFNDVSVHCKANIYFEGKVVSHTILFKSGEKKTLGLIYPGSFTFNTGVPEKMEIVAGLCSVLVKGSEKKSYKQGEFFDVPGNSSFDITVESGIVEYICSFE